jgi:hypothetical protein
MLNFEQFINEAKASHGLRPKMSQEEAIRLIELGFLDLVEYVDRWIWNPEALMMYIRALPNPDNVMIRKTENEITLTYVKNSYVLGFANAAYHLINDGEAVYGYITNKVYDEDDDKDPYGSDEDANSLAAKIRRFMEHPYEYTGSFQ